MAEASTTPAGNGIRVIPFCVPLPKLSPLSSFASASIEGTSRAGPPAQAGEEKLGIVGTITLRGRSAVIWFGWGLMEAVPDAGDVGCGDFPSREDVATVFGNGMPPMGSLALSMPPLNRRNNVDVPTTQLLGASSDEDMVLGSQISARLAKRVGWPIFVSCSFGGWAGDSGSGGGDPGASLASPGIEAGYDDMQTQRAAALAEKEVGRILVDAKKRFEEEGTKQ